ncbi:hypothetical protein FOXYSP1_04480 [Fusarium oxysporum f. sp. phaseoli]
MSVAHHACVFPAVHFHLEERSQERTSTRFHAKVKVLAS